MTRTAYLDCVGGLAGDMLLGALLDAGGSLERLRAVPERLRIAPTSVEVERAERHGISALRVSVASPDEQVGRRWTEIRTLVEEADLSTAVRAGALSVFGRLAEAEARVHGVSPEEVHFHELGAVDTLVDVCGALVLIEELGIERVVCSPLPLARGLVTAAHGRLPLPAPATLGVLSGARVVGVEAEGELVTPTGAALAAELADEWGELPPLVLERVGYGAGTRDPDDRPNLVRVVLGSADRQSDIGDVSVLETNLDDVNPQLLPDAVDRCLAAGALDAWVAPVVMKKGRPGFVLSAMTRRGGEPAVARAILEETTSLGVRVSHLQRYELEREERLVEVDGRPVRVKLALLDGRIVNVAPEHDDCAALATELGRSVKAVWVAALAASSEL